MRENLVLPYFLQNNEVLVLYIICKVSYNMVCSEHIIVTMTSWNKRVNNILPVLNSILSQTISPEQIILNLCTEDFPNMEKDLPSDLLTLLRGRPQIKLYWFIENYKGWKKHLHTLEIASDDDLIICIDDDFIYPNNFIETLYASYCYYGKQYPITMDRRWLLCNLWSFKGCGTLYRKKDLPKDYKKYLTYDVLHYALEDFMMLILFAMNKIPLMPMKYEFPDETEFAYNSVYPMSMISYDDPEFERKHSELISNSLSAICTSLADNYFKSDPGFTPNYWAIFSSLIEEERHVEYPFPEMQFSIDCWSTYYLTDGPQGDFIKKKLHLNIPL